MIYRIYNMRLPLTFFNLPESRFRKFRRLHPKSKLILKNWESRCAVVLWLICRIYCEIKILFQIS